MIKQVNVFLQNQPGILSNLTKILMDNDINLRALNVAETADFGILRIIVDKSEECVKALKAENYLVNVISVIAIEIPDKPGGLHEITKILGAARINIEYLYSTILKDEAIIIIRVDDNDKTIEILEKGGIKLITAF